MHEERLPLRGGGPGTGPTDEEIHRAGELHKTHSYKVVGQILTQELGRNVSTMCAYNWVQRYYAQEQYLELWKNEVWRQRLTGVYEMLMSLCWMEFSQDTRLAEFHQLKRNPNPKYGVTEYVRDIRGVAADIRKMYGLDEPARVAISDDREQPTPSPGLLELMRLAEEANARTRAAIEARENKEAS